ncbi:hypothetical protein [Desulfovibrio oxyclinae]|uniref:hypothetical protein n=1 Tax=Desulfovibrio oxyclinae TaxID=63560 RepID=UPI000379CD9F|nr:hypothetical protein [Desulfovibrio oxyclinae]
MARVVQKLQQRRGAQPSINARAADSYVRQLPGMIGRPNMKSGGWTQLASALSDAEPKLQRFLDGKHEQWKSDQLEEGVALFQKNRMAWKEFVAANPEYAGANPHLQRGFNLAWLQNKGLDFEAELNGWWEDNRNKVDPNDPTSVNQGMNQFAEEWMEREFGQTDIDDDLVAEGLQKPMQKAIESVFTRHNQWRMNANIERAKTELGGYVNRIGDKYALAGDWETSAGTVESAQKLAVEIQGQLDDMIANGLSATEANQRVVDELATVAKEHQNAEIMQALDYISTAKDENGKPIATLGGGGYGARVRENVENLIENQEMKKWDFERRQEAHFKQQKAESLIAELQTEMLDDPSADYTQNELYRELTRLDPSKARSLIGFQDRVITAKTTKFVPTEDSIETAADFRLRISKFDITPDEIREGLMTKYDMSTFKALMDDYDSTMRYENQLRDGTVSQIARDTSRVIRGSDPYSVTADDDLRATEARNLFNDKLITWMEEYQEEHNGNKPPLRSVRLKAYDLQEEILKMERFKPRDINQPLESPSSISAQEDRDQFLQLLMAYNAGETTEMSQLAQQAGVSDVDAFIVQRAKELGLERYIQVAEDTQE